MQARTNSFASETREYFEKAHAMMWGEWAAHASAILVSFDRFTQRVLDLEGLTVLRAWMPSVADEIEKVGIQAHEPHAKSVEQWGQVWAR